MSAPDDGSTGEHVRRFSVNLTDKSVKAMATAQEIAEETKSDVVNRGVQLYAYLLKNDADGGEVMVRLPGEDKVRTIHFL